MRGAGGSFEEELRARGARKYEGSIVVLKRFVELAVKALEEVTVNHFTVGGGDYEAAVKLRLESVRNTVGWLPSTTYISSILLRGSVLAYRATDDMKEVLRVIYRMRVALEEELEALAERLASACSSMLTGDSILFVSRSLGAECIKRAGGGPYPVFEGGLWNVARGIAVATGGAVIAYPESLAYSALKRYRSLVVELDGIAGNTVYLRAGGRAVLEAARRLDVRIGGLAHDLAVYPAELEGGEEKVPHTVVYTEWGEPVSLPIYETAPLELLDFVTTGRRTYNREDYDELLFDASDKARVIVASAVRGLRRRQQE